MMKRSGITALLCAVAAGCGAANPANQLSPSSVATVATSDGGTSARFGPQSIGSCPDGNAPSWLQPWTQATTARLRWTEVAPVIEYHVVVERYDVTNRYIPVENGDLMVNNTTWVELALSEGRYRARIQTKSCGRYMGPWSEDLQFSVNGTESAAGEAPASLESAEGSRLFPNSGQSLIDASGAVWTFGIEGDLPGIHQVLRNNVFVDGWGSQLKYHNHAVYLHGADGNWYLWDGAGWPNVGPVEP